MDRRPSTFAVSVGGIVLAIGAVTFITSSSLAAMYQAPIWLDAIVGGLSFPVAALAWHGIHERRDRDGEPLFGPWGRLALRQVVISGILLGLCFGVLRDETEEALAEHRGWIVGHTQKRTAEDCDIRGGTHPDWRKDLRAARAEAARTDKPLLILFTADWCHYCEELKRETLCAPEVVEMIDEDYVGVMLDDESVDRRIKDEFRVTGFPKLIVLTPGPDERTLSRNPGGWEREKVGPWLERQLERAKTER